MTLASGRAGHLYIDLIRFKYPFQDHLFGVVYSI